MNRKMIIYFLGIVMFLEGALFALPIVTSIIYREKTFLVFVLCAVLCLGIGWVCMRNKPEITTFYAREGFVCVALSWIVLSIIGALPFYISREIPSFTDALFETVSGFTTTGASILSDVECLSRSILMWRSFTHWIGGMGVLVFVLAILPKSGGNDIHIMRAESPGPSVSKFTPKVRSTAMILYVIYFLMTVTEIILLIATKMEVFDAIAISFGSAGTGGFGVKNSSIGGYTVTQQIITSVFMAMFGINFNVYCLMYMKKFKDAIKCEEMRIYLSIIALSTLGITFNIWHDMGLNGSFGRTLLDSFVQVCSIITTTGFSSVDFDLWPTFSKGILVLLMFVGACAGSTGGGLKVSRVAIAFKTVIKEMQQMLHPRSIKVLRFEGKPIEHKVLRSINTYIMLFVFTLFASIMLVSIDGFDMVTTVTAVIASFGNIGPGLGMVGPTCNYAFFSPFAKYVLMFDMLAGRLELFPIILLFSSRTWRKQL